MRGFVRSAALGVTMVCVALTCLGQEKGFTKLDLKSTWKVFQNDSYLPYDGSPVGAIYFEINTDHFYRDKLVVESKRPFTLFIDRQLVAESNRISWPLDSLAKAYGKSVLSLAIHQPSISAEMITIIQSDQPPTKGEESFGRMSFSFRDFAISGILILFVMLIVLIRLNPKLASDYFSVTKIFSLRDSDEGQVYTRTTSSTNMLFYVFGSLILGYYLVVIFHFVQHRFPLAPSFYSEDFFGALYQWIRLSAIILGVFFIKIVLIYALTFLFGAPEVMGLHFFNWVRVILVTFGLLTVILSVYFIVHGQRPTFFSFLFFMIPWISGGFIVLMLMKLSVRARQSLFHIFSYICATELIPFLITLKVLFN